MNKSFCFESLRIDTRSLPGLSDRNCLTPQYPRTHQRNSAKSFVNLYLKARSQDHLNSPQLKGNHQFEEAKEEVKSATIIKFSNHTDHFYKPNSLNPFTTEKPSQFKLNSKKNDDQEESIVETIPQEAPQQENFINRDYGIIENNFEEENRNGVQSENEIAENITQNDLPSTDRNTITRGDTRPRTPLDPLSIQIFRNYGITLVAYCLLLGFHAKLYTYRFVFAFLWTLQIYLLYSSTRNHSSIDGPKRVNLIFGLVALFAFEVFGFLRLENVQVPLTISLVPISFSVILSCYFNIYRNNGNPQFLGLVLKLSLWLQVLFICLKTDSFLDWTWQKVFCIVWVFLAGASLYCLGLVGMFVFTLCFDRSSNYRDPQVVGLFWISSTFSGYILLVFLLTFGFAKQLQTGENQPLILGSLIAGICQIVFLTIFTTFQRVKIRLFINQIMGNETSTTEPKTFRIKLQKDSYNLPSHIVMFSSSYFLTLNQSFKLKDKQKLKNFQKRVLLIKNGTCNSERSYNTPLIQQDTTLLVPQNQPLSRLSGQRKPKPLIIPSSLQNKKLECFSASLKQTAIINSSDFAEDQKLCFTADDLDYAKQMNYTDFLSSLQTPHLKKRASEKEDDKVCIICCDRAADAVIMGCGHGGVCYKCALESCQKSDKCFMCRKKIDKVLHIATHKIPKFNLIKVLSATKIVNEPLSATSSTSQNN